jgi:hypothetical protein
LSDFTHANAPSLTLFPIKYSAETLFVTKHGVNKGKVKCIRAMGMLLLKWKKGWLGKL